MREYEVTIVLKPNLETQVRDEIIERVAGWLTPDGDETKKPVIHHWGQRSLAYPIKDNHEGYYVLYEAKMEPPSVQAVDRDILFLEDIIRHLVVRKED